MTFKNMFAWLLLVAVAVAGCGGGTEIPDDPGLGGDMRDEMREAIANGDEGAVRELLSAQPLLATEPHPASGQTPLHTAAAANNAAIIQILIESGADPAAMDDEGETPRDIANRNGASQEVLNLLE